MVKRVERAAGPLVQVRLLGPVDVMVDGAPRPVCGQRRKALLTVLALHAGEVVSTGDLVAAVWGDDGPPGAVNTLRSHLSYLRTVLGDKDAIMASPPGYVLKLAGEATDVRAAERLLEEGSQAASPDERVRCLRAALGLRRGRPLADLNSLPGLHQQTERLAVLDARLRWALVEVGLAVGEHAQVVPELERMAAEHPLDEQICGQLMVALYHSGRQADALAAFQRLRRTLGEELGIDPGQKLREIEASILRQEVPPAAPPEVPVARRMTAGRPVPAQLPSAVPGFAGRAVELASLDAILPGTDPAGAPAPAAVVITAVLGTAGVGKTTLAVQWAHRIAGRFPDGQLYVNLRGFDPAAPPLAAAEAVRRFLDALGVPVHRIPEGLDAQAALYRSLLAGKRVLVVLDNARDAAQVRPLLPDSPGCLAIVTSRNQLAGLAAEGAYPLALDLLTTAEARDMLAQRLGPQRVASEPQAVEEIIERCARLPLALAVVAARAATSPGFPLAAIAADLGHALRALDTFDSGDTSTDVRSVLSCSYRALSVGAARLFRLLGLHPGLDIAPAAAASLAAIPLRQALALLAELTHAHLLSEPTPGRYAFHDLLRAYAAECAHSSDGREICDAAVHRVLDHYLHTARRAATLLDPHRDPPVLAPALPEVAVAELATAEDALDWFTAEQATLLAAVPLAAGAGFAAHAWQLAWTLTGFLLRRGLWHEQAAACQAGLAAARRSNDTAGEARSLHGLARGYVRSGRLHEAGPLLRQALQLFEAVDDKVSQALVYSLLGSAERELGGLDRLLSHSSRALDLCRAAGHRAGEAAILNDIGFAHALLGNYREALACCEQALAGAIELGEHICEAATWDSLGYVHRQRGDHQQAITCYRRSIRIWRELSDQQNEADTLSNLGDAHQNAGDPIAAHRAWTQALRIFDEIDHPDGERVRAKLHGNGAGARPAG